MLYDLSITDDLSKQKPCIAHFSKPNTTEKKHIIIQRPANYTRFIG